MVDERAHASPEDDAWLALLHQAQAGDALALNRLLGDVRPYLKALVEHLRREQRSGQGDASDVVQDCLLRIAQHVAGVRAVTDAEFLSWLATLARHGLLKAVRDARRQKRDTRREIPLDEDDSGAVYIQADDSTPSQHAVHREEEQAWEAAIGRLAPDNQQVLGLRFRENRPWPEIAAVMGRSEDAVKQLYFRMVKRLRRRLGESR